MNNKIFIRSLFRGKRQLIPLEKRGFAARKLFSELHPKIKKYLYILSFASFAEEIDMWRLNFLLAQEGRLLLPRIEQDELKIFFVSDFSSQLALSKYNILEPIPEKCNLCPIEQISCILVPGVAFDNYGNRIGFGKGHYDKFLSTSKAIKWGIGFKEQLSQTALPKDPHDIPMDELLLF